MTASATWWISDKSEGATMLGMGFLRRNRILAKHKWRRKNDGVSVEEERTREESSFSLWLVAITVIFVIVLIVEILRTS